MDGLARDGILNQDFGKLDGVLDGFHKDNDLIELKIVNQIHQLCNLFTLI